MWQHADVRHPSMNLGQAVAVCLYELVRNSTHDNQTVANGEPDNPTSQNPDMGHPTEAAVLERLSTLLSEVLEKTEYTRRHPADKNPAQMRHLVRRMGVNTEDAPVWLGILRQVLWKLGSREG
jgi:tRNA C32,U32 (ribose-2'-O)-methylase TrmJ